MNFVFDAQLSKLIHYLNKFYLFNSLECLKKFIYKLYYASLLIFQNIHTGFPKDLYKQFSNNLVLKIQ